MTFTTRPTLAGTFGMVSSTHWLASQSAQRMLELGGNAFDAAAAGGFVLHVVEPHLNGPGGRPPGDRRDRRGPDPARAVRPGPGAGGSDTGGLRRHGPRPRPRLGTARRGRARRGRRVAAPAARPRHAPAARRPRAGDRLRPRRSSAARPRGRDDRPGAGPVPRRTGRPRPTLWLRGGRVPRAGELFANPVYAAVLERLVDAAEAAGPTWPRRRRRPATPGARASSPRPSRRSVRAAWRHSGGEVLPGLVGGDDLAAFSATWEAPVTPSGTASQVAKTGLWGQGPALLQVLAMLDELGQRRSTPPPRRASTPSPRRGSWRWPTARPGTATPRRSPVDDLLAPATSPSALRWSASGRRPRRPPGRPAVASPARRARAAPARRRGHRPRGRRDHRRADGRSATATVAATPATSTSSTAGATSSRRRPSGGWLQCSPTIPELGFCLGSRAQMFWLDEGLPRLARARRPAAHDADPDAGPARRRAGARLRLARRRPAGPVAVAVPAAPRRRRDGASRRRSTPRRSTRTSFPGSFHPREMEPGVLVVEDRFPDAVLDDAPAAAGTR